MLTNTASTFNSAAGKRPSVNGPATREQQLRARANVIAFPLRAYEPDATAPGEDGCHQPGKGPVTAFLKAFGTVLAVGVVSHIVGVL